jgi:hypothetical protein
MAGRIALRCSFRKGLMRLKVAHKLSHPAGIDSMSLPNMLEISLKGQVELRENPTCTREK